jgi:prevent-host-death family protein
MHTVNVHEAKTHLSQLLDEVAAGGEVMIAEAGRPVARLIGYQHRPGQRQFGRDSGLFSVPEDFVDPLPDEILAAFEQ